MGNAIENGIASARAGNKSAALQFLKQAVDENPRDISAWLWIYHVSDDLEQKKHCLQRILAIDPRNQYALQQSSILNAQKPVITSVFAERQVNNPSTFVSPSNVYYPNQVQQQVNPEKSGQKTGMKIWLIILGLIFLCLFAMFIVQVIYFSAVGVPPEFLQNQPAMITDPLVSAILMAVSVTLVIASYGLIGLWVISGYIGAFHIIRKGYALELIGCSILAGGLPLFLPAILGPVLYFWGASVQKK